MMKFSSILLGFYYIIQFSNLDLWVFVKLINMKINFMFIDFTCFG